MQCAICVHDHSFEKCWSLVPAFLLLAIYIYTVKKLYNRFKMLEACAFWDISNSQNSTKFWKKIPDFSTLFKVESQKYKGYFFNLLSYLGCSQIWQKSSCQSWPLWLQLKIHPQKTWITATCYCKMQVHHLGLSKFWKCSLKVHSHLVWGTLVLSPLTSC